MVGLTLLFCILVAVALTVLPTVWEDATSSCDALNRRLMRGTVREVVKHEIENFIPKEWKDMVVKATSAWRSSPSSEIPPAQRLLYQTRSNPSLHPFIPWVNYWNDETLCRFLYWEQITNDSWKYTSDAIGFWRNYFQEMIP